MNTVTSRFPLNKHSKVELDAILSQINETLQNKTKTFRRQKKSTFFFCKAHTESKVNYNNKILATVIFRSLKCLFILFTHQSDPLPCLPASGIQLAPFVILFHSNLLHTFVLNIHKFFKYARLFFSFFRIIILQSDFLVDNSSNI